MTAPAIGEEHLYLIGHTALNEYLDFMATQPVNATQRDPMKSADEWRTAHEYLGKLQDVEAGWADEPFLQPLPHALEPLVARVRSDPVFQRAFTVVPVALGLVELDRLVPKQA